MRKILVSCFLAYLRLFTKLQLKKINPIIIGVGGSSGKSSLCELIYISLSGTYTVKQGRGKNSETGIPLDVLGIHMKAYGAKDWLYVLLLAPIKIFTNKERYQVYVVEMGIDSPVEPKNMSYLLKIIRPALAVTTNISFEHTQYFDALVHDTDESKRKETLLQLTADQELLLLTSLQPENTAIVNLDDLLIKNAQSRIRAKSITISLSSSEADIYARKISIDSHSFILTFIAAPANKDPFTVRIPHLLPKHYASSLLSVVGICVALGVDIKDAIKKIETHFSLPPGRSSVFTGIKDTIIIDSTYNNATLPPMLDMLDLLVTVGKNKRKVAIIGDMRELGTMSREHHEIVAEKLSQTADLTILIGPMMEQYAAPVLERNNSLYHSYATFTLAKDHVLKTLKKGDVILVKGSQNQLFLERVVEMLLADKKDVSKLCRRGYYWDMQRKKTP